LSGCNIGELESNDSPELDQMIIPASDISQSQPSGELSDCIIDELETNDSPEVDHSRIATVDISQGSEELSDCNNDELEYNDSCETTVKILPPGVRVLIILGMLCSQALSVYLFLLIFGFIPVPWHR